MCTGVRWPPLLTPPSPGAGLGCRELLPRRDTLYRARIVFLWKSRVSRALSFLPLEDVTSVQIGCVLGSHVLPRRPDSSRAKASKDIHVSTNVC